MQRMHEATIAHATRAKVMCLAPHGFKTQDVM